MAVIHLTQDEREYEMKIRSDYTNPPHHLLMSQMGILAYWLNHEKTNNIDPITLAHRIASENIDEENDASVVKVNEIHQSIISECLAIDLSNEENVQKVIALVTQLLHYDMRLKRLEGSEFSEQRTNARTEARQKCDISRAILNGILADMPAAPNITMANSSNASSNNTASTASGSTQTHSVLTDNNAQVNDPNLNSNGSANDSARPLDLNSTAINADHLQANLSSSTSADSPYNAAADMQRRRDAETARRMSEFHVCKGRIEDLHEDIEGEYCRSTSPRRSSEAQPLYERLRALEACLNGILALTVDATFKLEITRQKEILLRDAYVLQFNVMIAATNSGDRTATTNSIPPAPRQNITHTVGQAHSTIRPQQQQISVPYFTRELDAMTFNVSHPFNVNDSQTIRGMEAIVNDARNAGQSPHVTFGANQQIPCTPQTPSTQSAYTHPSQHRNNVDDGIRVNATPEQNGFSHPPQQRANFDAGIRVNAMPEQNVGRSSPSEPCFSSPIRTNGASNLRTGAFNNVNAGMPSRVVQSRAFHPAVSPYHYPEYAYEPRNNSHTSTSAPMEQLPTMNACQGQQFLSRVLGHRRYEGNVTDGNKSISLDEFMGHARSYQRSTGTTDGVVLSQLATFFSNQAFRWWQTNSTSITSLDELETRLKSRFEGKSSDGLSVLTEFCTRKQQRNEKLLDYVDDMRQLANACHPALTVPQVVTRIIDNSLEKYRNLLALRQYESVEALTLCAEYLVRAEPPSKNDIPSFVPKKQGYPTHYQQKSIYAVEAEPDSSDLTPESIEHHSEAEDVVETMVDMITRKLNHWSGQKKPLNGPRTAPAQSQNVASNANENATNANRSVRPISCWGCQMPGIYQQNCPKCNGPKNGQANL